jgi:hypothetical protein
MVQFEVTDFESQLCSCVQIVVTPWLDDTSASPVSLLLADGSHQHVAAAAPAHGRRIGKEPVTLSNLIIN